MVVEKSTKREIATSKPMQMSRPSAPLTKGVPKKVCQAGFCCTGNGSVTLLSFSGAGTRSGVMRTSLTRFRRDCIDKVACRVSCIQSPRLVLNLMSYYYIHIACQLNEITDRIPIHHTLCR